MFRKSRVIIDDAIGKLTITVKPGKSLGMAAFGLLWLAGWIYGCRNTYWFLFSSHTKFNDTYKFILAWTSVWTLGGLFFLFLLLWMFFGKEEITVAYGELRLRKTLFNFRKGKQMNLHQITNVRIEETSMARFNSRKNSNLIVGPGKVRFDYNGKTYNFGNGISDSEANGIAELLSRKIRW